MEETTPDLCVTSACYSADSLLCGLYETDNPCLKYATYHIIYHIIPKSTRAPKVKRYIQCAGSYLFRLILSVAVNTAPVDTFFQQQSPVFLHTISTNSSSSGSSNTSTTSGYRFRLLVITTDTGKSIFITGWAQEQLTLALPWLRFHCVRHSE